MKYSGILFSVLFFAFLACSTSNTTRTSYANLPFLKGLNAVSTMELMQNGSMIEDGQEPSFYLPDGRKLTFLEMIDSTRDGKYGLVPFVDSSEVLALYLLRPTSEFERNLINRANTRSKKKGPDLLESFAPTFTLFDIDGNKLPLSAFRGKVIVLNFWFIDCAPCIAEMPELNQLVEKYKGQDVVFLAIALDSKYSIKKFLKTNDFDYRILAEGRAVAETYEIQSYPSNIVIDRHFIIAHYSSGYGKKKVPALDEAIEHALH